MIEKEVGVKEALDVLQDLKFHTGAVDMKVVALTGLLLDKGIITEKEIQQSYVKVIEAVKNHGDKNDSRAEEFESYLADFLQVSKKDE